MTIVRKKGNPMNDASPVAYDVVSRINHWIMALAMIGMLSVGLFVANVEIPKETRGFLIGIHKAAGVLVLLYGAWRVAWRLGQGFPRPASVVPAWQARAAKLSHYGLLAGILLMPLTGLVGSLFRDRSVNFFNLFTIPPFGEIKILAAIGSNLHWIVGYLLVAMVVLHIAAALKHHFVDRDTTLARMVRSTPVG